MICAIVLAAGESRRMGTQKLLLPFGDATVVTHVVEQLLRSLANQIYVVVGHQRERIVGELSGLPVSIIENADYKAGMLSSVRCGLRALPEGCEAALIALGDQPALTSTLVSEMVQAFAGTDKGILVPTHQGKRGHPLLFSTQYRDEILTRYDDVGLRGLLHAHPEDILQFHVPTTAVLSDMDYPEDYRRETDLFGAVAPEIKPTLRRLPEI
ncbi:MAG TPA: nucleotidyltransferase family protein [Sumerlaeia bacterium]|nr:nucleotidyltransferase family protein [Sumerlaeia bacterium]